MIIIITSPKAAKNPKLIIMVETDRKNMLINFASFSAFAFAFFIGCCFSGCD